MPASIDGRRFPPLNGAKDLLDCLEGDNSRGVFVNTEVIRSHSFFSRNFELLWRYDSLQCGNRDSSYLQVCGYIWDTLHAEFASTASALSRSLRWMWSRDQLPTRPERRSAASPLRITRLSTASSKTRTWSRLRSLSFFSFNSSL